MDKPIQTQERVFNIKQVEELLRNQRMLIADKLVPSRKGIVQETEYHRIMNAKLKVK